ncbi:MAG: DUF2190 family protein [Archangium sp.]|nr:DUF2190 family protein [Archangium sp.]
MSFTNNQGISSVTGFASAAITRRRFVRFTAANFVATQVAAASEIADGVATESQATVGGALEVQTDGIALMEAGAAIAAGAEVTSDASGRAITAASGNVAHGKMVGPAAGAAGEFIQIKLKTPNVRGPVIP